MISSLLKVSWVRILLSLLRLVVVPVAVGWLIISLLKQSPDLDLKLKPFWLVLSVLTIQLSLWIVSMRIVQLLAIYELGTTTLTALKINLRSLFYFLVLPTHAGMEAVRFFGICQAVPTADKTTVAAVILLDRLFGALAAAALCSIAAIQVLPGHLDTLSFSTRDWPVGLAMGAMGVLFVILFVLRHRLNLLLQRIVSILKPLTHARGYLLVVFFWAALSQVFVVAGVAFALLGIGVDIPVAALAFAIMGGTFLMLVPVSFAGLGAAEVAGVVLLIAVGVNEPAAATAVFVTYLTRVFAGLQGAALEIWAGGLSLRTFRDPVGPNADQN